MQINSTSFSIKIDASMAVLMTVIASSHSGNSGLCYYPAFNAWAKISATALFHFLLGFLSNCLSVMTNNVNQSLLTLTSTTAP